MLTRPILAKRTLVGAKQIRIDDPGKKRSAGAGDPGYNQIALLRIESIFALSGQWKRSGFRGGEHRNSGRRLILERAQEGVTLSGHTVDHGKRYRAGVPE